MFRSSLAIRTLTSILMAVSWASAVGQDSLDLDKLRSDKKELQLRVSRLRSLHDKEIVSKGELQRAQKRLMTVTIHLAQAEENTALVVKELQKLIEILEQELDSASALRRKGVIADLEVEHVNRQLWSASAQLAKMENRARDTLSFLTRITELDARAVQRAGRLLRAGAIAQSRFDQIAERFQQSKERLDELQLQLNRS